MGDEEAVVNAFEQLKEYYEGEQEQEQQVHVLLNTLIDEMEKFKGSEENVKEIRNAIKQLDGSDDEETSASAAGSFFRGVTAAFSKFLTKQNIQYASQRLREEVYSRIAEEALEKARQPPPSK